MRLALRVFSIVGSAAKRSEIDGLRAKRKSWRLGLQLFVHRRGENYAFVLRRRIPAKPRTPEPNNIRVPGSGVGA